MTYSEFYMMFSILQVCRATHRKPYPDSAVRSVDPELIPLAIAVCRLLVSDPFVPVLLHVLKETSGCRRGYAARELDALQVLEAVPVPMPVTIKLEREALVTLLINHYCLPWREEEYGDATVENDAYGDDAGCYLHTPAFFRMCGKRSDGAHFVTRPC